MNYLFHLYLSGSDPDVMTGNFMGDFVKGRLGDFYPPGITTGIRLHRSIDSFAQHHPAFTRSRLRLAEDLGLYRGIIVDLFYDHFLSSGWDRWHPDPLQRYLERSRRAIEERIEFLPERLRTLLPVIFEDMIPSYLTTDGVTLALTRMSRRITRVNPLARGGDELIRHYDDLHRDFLEFLPSVKEYASRSLLTAPLPPRPPR